jgi:uncharacterized membrane protein
MGSSDAVDPARDCRRLLAMAQPERMRLVFLGFDDESPAYSVLDVLKSGIAKKDVVVWDWALLKTEPGGNVKITTDKSVDPGAARGAALGGAAGLVLAALSGPIGVGAVLGGAALGSVTAAMKDSGFKNEDLEAVSRLMADGRSGLMIAVPLPDVDRFDAFVAGHQEFTSADRRHQVDIVPGRTFEQALAEYRLHEED